MGHVNKKMENETDLVKEFFDGLTEYCTSIEFAKMLKMPARTLRRKITQCPPGLYIPDAILRCPGGKKVYLFERNRAQRMAFLDSLPKDRPLTKRQQAKYEALFGKKATAPTQ